MATAAPALQDPNLDSLVNLIRDSFRVRPNQDPIYVDVGGHLSRVAAPQHQVIYGRRGSGKSCLLVHFHRRVANQTGAFSIYIDCDEIKRLSYPDLLIRLLLRILDKLPIARHPKWKFWAKPSSAELAIKELRALLDLAEDADVTEQSSSLEAAKLETKLDAPRFAKVGGTVTSETSKGRTSAFHERKLDTLERHFQDYKDALVSALRATGSSHGALILDDFYLIHPTVQPDVIDYVHRLLRGTSLYFKIGTVRHRTSLVRTEGHTIGVEEYQDIEELNLDRTFEDTSATQQYLETMLDSMGRQRGIEDASHRLLSSDGRLALALASGGVPRDYLTIFVEAIDAAKTTSKTKWLTPTTVYKGAGRVSYRTKVHHLRNDVGLDASPLERVFQDLLEFCLREKRKTAFLIAQSEVVQFSEEHELLLQLMDFKLVHVIESDTSAASGRRGRFEAYTLDFALFMEPRLRGIEHVEFWRVDAQRRRSGVREAPVYELSRAATKARATQPTPSTEDVVASIEAEAGIDTAEEEEE